MKGTDSARSRCRMELNALIAFRGPPSIFFTLNPADALSPLTAQYGGHKLADAVNMTWRQRAVLVADDPVASVKFFHCVTRAFLEFLVAPAREHGGAFGPVSSYYGTLEVQGRG